MSSSNGLRAGDRVLVGTHLVEVTEQFAAQLADGDEVLGIAATGSLRRIPSETRALVDAGVGRALTAFSQLQIMSQVAVTRFFVSAADLLADDSVFDAVARANAADVASARERGRSTTRLVLSPKMRTDMISAFRMWASLDLEFENSIDTVTHDGWKVDQIRSPLGVIGFVFEGRPNVFADATGVLRGGNTVVFRIGSDALGTARAIMDNIVEPALTRAMLPSGCVTLLDSAEHSAGWALFSDGRLSLAVARGSGEAVAELGSIAQQSGIPVSLHGTGGAWVIAGDEADTRRLFDIVQHSLDRKVCNTMNVVCIPRHRAADLVPAVYEAARKAARARGTEPRIHEVGGAEDHLPSGITVSVQRADGTHEEPQVSAGRVENLGHEFEWEENPEFHLVLVDSLDEAVTLFNTYSPHFIVSVCSESEREKQSVWTHCDAPFVGDGFTRWVDGQFALLRPELGLSNWQHGRLFARSGILSGDSAFTVRLRVTQTDSSLHR